MSDVQFESEQGLNTPVLLLEKARGGLVGLLLRTGMVKTEAHANIILIGIILASLIFMLFKGITLVRGEGQEEVLDIKTIDQTQFMNIR